LNNISIFDILPEKNKNIHQVLVEDVFGQMISQIGGTRKNVGTFFAMKQLCSGCGN
jgi:hypothetical protein